MYVVTIFRNSYRIAMQKAHVDCFRYLYTKIADDPCINQPLSGEEETEVSI